MFSNIKDIPYMIYEEPEFSMIEITTKIGCKVNCKYCPQNRLISEYAKRSNQEYFLMDDFKKVLNSIPTVTHIRFCGMVEPFLNPNCADMIVYAKEKGFCVDCYSTLVGLDINDVDRVLNVVDDFVLHVPDKKRNAKIDVTDEYIKVLKRVLEYKRDGIRVVNNISVHGEVDDRVRDLIPTDIVPQMWMQDRAGNLDSDDLHVLHYKVSAPMRCKFCHNRLDCNILLPNGDLVMCCMDYSMKHIFGNLFEDSYEVVLNSVQADKVRHALIDGSQETLCNSCVFAEELLC